MTTEATEATTYETAVGRLEEIIRRLDSGEAGLRETLDLCREGKTLIDYAAGELEAVGKGLEELRLDELVADVVERARRRHPAREFRLQSEPALVCGIGSRLDRAVANLLDNAQKWSPPGEPVEVRVAGGGVTVRDHGPGFAEADLPHVFERFYRSASARRLPGSGLGLAIVRQIAEAHGGSVSAEAAPGGGALLRLRLSSSS